MSRKIKPTCCDSQDRAFAGASCAELDGQFDREAVHLICNHGILANGNPALIGDAVDRLYDHGAHRRKVEAVIAKLEKIGMTEEQGKLVSDIEDLLFHDLVDAREAAYFLGIAVGRRVGALPLRHTRAKAGVK